MYIFLAHCMQDFAGELAWGLSHTKCGVARSSHDRKNLSQRIWELQNSHCDRCLAVSVNISLKVFHFNCVLLKQVHGSKLFVKI